jgi:hypothetical protein
VIVAYMRHPLHRRKETSECPASRPGRALPPRKGFRYPVDRRLGGLRAGLDTEARGKFYASAGDRPPVVQSVVRHYTE